MVGRRYPHRSRLLYSNFSVFWEKDATVNIFPSHFSLCVKRINLFCVQCNTIFDIGPVFFGANALPRAGIDF